MTTARIAGAVLCVLLGGCAGAGYSLSDAPQARDGGMAGRWMLAAPNAPACGMNFAGADGAREGRVLPDGGCPGRFFLSRRWTLSDGALKIADQDGETLAEFKRAEGRFEGKATGGMAVTLTRAAPTT